MTGDVYQLLPSLDADDLDALRADIVANGIRVPIDVDENGVTLDGHHRRMIADELGIACPTRVVAGLTETQKRDHAMTVNTARRQLSREQKRALIAASLAADPELSDREHSRRVGCSPTTVGTVRREMSGEVSNMDTYSKADAERDLASAESVIEAGREVFTNAVRERFAIAVQVGSDLAECAAGLRLGVVRESEGTDPEILALTLPWAFDMIDDARAAAEAAVTKTVEVSNLDSQKGYARDSLDVLGEMDIDEADADEVASVIDEAANLLDQLAEMLGSPAKARQLLNAKRLPAAANSGRWSV